MHANKSMEYYVKATNKETSKKESKSSRNDLLEV